MLGLELAEDPQHVRSRRVSIAVGISQESIFICRMLPPDDLDRGNCVVHINGSITVHISPKRGDNGGIDDGSHVIHCCCEHWLLRFTALECLYFPSGMDADEEGAECAGNTKYQKGDVALTQEVLEREWVCVHNS